MRVDQHAQLSIEESTNLQSIAQWCSSQAGRACEGLPGWTPAGLLALVAAQRGSYHRWYAPTLDPHRPGQVPHLPRHVVARFSADHISTVGAPSPPRPMLPGATWAHSWASMLTACSKVPASRGFGNQLSSAGLSARQVSWKVDRPQAPRRPKMRCQGMPGRKTAVLHTHSFWNGQWPSHGRARQGHEDTAPSAETVPSASNNGAGQTETRLWKRILCTAYVCAACGLHRRCGLLRIDRQSGMRQLNGCALPMPTMRKRTARQGSMHRAELFSGSSAASSFR